MADTRGIQQDELQKKSIVNQIEENVDSITAVLVLANGTFTVGTDYALSTLSTLFPKSLANNIAFMFTHVLSPLHPNFSRDTIPDDLKNTPQFAFNNPVALRKRYLKLKGGSSNSKERADLRKAMKVAEQTALEMLVDLFDWLDSLEALSMKESGPLYEKAQAIDSTITNILAQMGQAATKKLEIDEQTREYQNCSAVSCSPCLHPRLGSYAHLDEGDGRLLPL